MTTMAQRGVTAGRHRLMGALAMIGGLCYLVMSIAYLLTGVETGLLFDVLGTLWSLSCLCGLVGIGLLGVLGRGLFGRVALVVALLAYAIAALDAVLILAGLYTGEGSPLFALSRLGTLVGMLLVGIAALVAGRWPGWRKFTPFAVPLAMPLALLSGVLTSGLIPITLFVGLAWLLIGYAVFSTPEPA
jgi:hypothetical protein